MPKALFLIPNTLGAADVSASLPPEVCTIVRRIKHFLVEDDKSARKLIIACGVPTPFNDIHFYRLDKRTPSEEISKFFEEAGDAEVGVISEAGCPGVADPGARAVALAHQKNIPVQPLVGPSSILLAIMASGFNGQSFTFHGYLPAAPVDRHKKVVDVENASRTTGFTQIFIETPYRNQHVLDTLKKACQPTTMLCIAHSLTLPEQEIISKPIGKWRNEPFEFRDKPAVFLLWAMKDRPQRPAFKRKR